ESVSWIPKEKALMRIGRYFLRTLPARKNRIVFALPIRCRFCSVAFLLPVFDTAPAAAARRAAVQATAWLLGSKKTDASAAAAPGAGQFNFRTPETEGCTKVCSGFFFWGIQSPFSSYNPQKVGSDSESSRGRLQPSRRAERDLLRRGGATERASGGERRRCERFGVRDDDTKKKMGVWKRPPVPAKRVKDSNHPTQYP
ncbi:MAG: hypothetical protein Q3977_01335, partial [Oscillospiraceae bacterium]|nr:hypothetical protein [Oscillospiraceae bacterium]